MQLITYTACVCYLQWIPTHETQKRDKSRNKARRYKTQHSIKESIHRSECLQHRQSTAVYAADIATSDSLLTYCDHVEGKLTDLDGIEGHANARKLDADVVRPAMLH